MTAAAPATPPPFDPARLDGLDEPVRRYFRHALAAGVPAGRGMRLRMRGRIRARMWLPFRAEWEGDGRSFGWTALAGPFGLPLLRVVDRFAGGSGSMDVRALGRLRLVHAEDSDTVRSGAGRAAAEAMWTPASLLPERGVAWHAERDDLVVARWPVPPEQPELRLRIAADGAVRTAAVMRWDGGAHGRRGYVPCGGHVLAERAFGGVTIPSRISVGWWFGTPRYAPFFEAEVTAAWPLA